MKFIEDIKELARQVMERGSKQMIYEEHLKNLGIDIIKKKGVKF